MTTQECVRLFLGIQFTEKNEFIIKQILSHLQQSISHEKVKWTPPNQFHITLHFLGNVAKIKIPQLINSLTTEINNHAQFSVKCEKLIGLPPKHPHIIALSVNLNHELGQLFRDTKKAIESFAIVL